MPVVKGIDYYGILELTKSCNDLDIKEAYYRLALKYRAGRATEPDAARKFTLIGEAYEVLQDPMLRTIYDIYGEAGLRNGILTPIGWHPAYVYHGDPLRTYREFFGTDSPYADLMEYVKQCEDMEPASNGDGFKSKQEEIRKSLPLTLEEIYNGTYKKVKIMRSVFKDSNQDSTEKREQILPIEVKPGLLPGTEIVFEGMGDEGATQIPGDVVFEVKDLPHKTYRREGINLLMTKKVTLNQALKGVIIKLKTLDGREMKTRITEVISPHYKKLIPGEGMPIAETPDTFGDLIINFSVEFPLYIPTPSKKIVDKGLTEAEVVEQTLFLQRRRMQEQESRESHVHPSQTCLA